MNYFRNPSTLVFLSVVMAASHSKKSVSLLLLLLMSALTAFDFTLALPTIRLASQKYTRMNLSSGVNGPESIAFDNAGGGPYTGVSDGRVVKRVPHKGWVDFATTSGRWGKKVCEGSQNTSGEPTCGRPLGLQFNRVTGNLFIADAYFGLLEVGPNGGLATQVAAAAEGQPFVFTNGLDINQANGVVYFTDSSARFQRRQNHMIVISGDRTGRLLSYDPRTRDVRVLLRGLAFANGVALSADNSFLLVAETSLSRVLRYWLAGARAGTHEVFAVVPGFPDNIKRNSRGEFWVSVSYGWQAKAEVRLPPSIFESSSEGMVVAKKFGGGGQLVDVIGSGDVGNMVEVSEVEENNGTLWIGSVVVPYIGCVRA